MQMHKHTQTYYKNVSKYPRLDVNRDSILGESTVLYRFCFLKPTYSRLRLDTDSNAQLVPSIS